jgi:hypothetical protein
MLYVCCKTIYTYTILPELFSHQQMVYCKGNLDLQLLQVRKACEVWNGFIEFVIV